VTLNSILVFLWIIAVFGINDLLNFCVLISCALIIFNQNKFPSLLQRRLLSDDMFTGARAGQPVNHMKSQQ